MNVLSFWSFSRWVTAFLHNAIQCHTVSAAEASLSGGVLESCVNAFVDFESEGSGWAVCPGKGLLEAMGHDC